MSFSKNKCLKIQSFTLLELIISILILGILTSLIVKITKPSEFFSNLRDTNRFTNLKKIEEMINIKISSSPYFNISQFASSNVIYISLPDESPTCTSYINDLPALPSGWTYRCSPNPENIDGTGWIPLNLQDVSNINKLPIDPRNTPGSFYSLIIGDNSFKLTAVLENEKNKKELAAKDGGINDNVLELGDSKLKMPLCFLVYQNPIETTTLISIFLAGDRPWTDMDANDKYLFYNEFYDSPPENHIIDITNPKNPIDVIRSVYPQPSTQYNWRPGQGVQGPEAIKDNYIFFYNRSTGKLEIYDFSNPLPKPTLVSSVSLPASWPEAVIIRDNLVYTLNQGGQIRIIDISTITSPTVIGMYDIGVTARAMKEKNGYLFVTTDGTYNFRIFDARNPSNITQISALSLAGSSYYHIQLEVYENAAYVVANNRIMYVINISNPASPNVVKIINTQYTPIDPGNALEAVEIFKGKRLYGGGGDTTEGVIEVFDISNPLEPNSLGTILTGENAFVRTLKIKNCHIYIGTRPTHDIRIFQIGRKY